MMGCATNQRYHLKLRNETGCGHNDQNHLKLRNEIGYGRNDWNHLKLMEGWDMVIMVEIT